MTGRPFALRYRLAKVPGDNGVQLWLAHALLRYAGFGHCVLRKSIMKLLCALLTALAIALLHCDWLDRFVCDMLSAEKKQGTPLITVGALPELFQYHKPLGVKPPAISPA